MARSGTPVCQSPVYGLVVRSECHPPRPAPRHPDGHVLVLVPLDCLVGWLKLKQPIYCSLSQLVNAHYFLKIGELMVVVVAFLFDWLATLERVWLKSSSEEDGGHRSRRQVLRGGSPVHGFVLQFRGSMTQHRRFCTCWLSQRVPVPLQGVFLLEVDG